MRAVSLYYVIFKIHRTEIPHDYNARPSVSVIVPCYNEGSHIYETLKSLAESDYPKERLEILVVDDCSGDDSWTWIEKAKKEFPSIIAVQNEVNLGKPMNMIKISQISKGEILIGTDGDTIWDKGAIKELVSCFKDPSIGAVGAVAGVYNVNASLLTQFQAVTYVIGFYLVKPIENLSGTNQCLGGAAIAFRADLYREKLVPLLEKRNFLGERIQHGEDRFATQMVLALGYRTFLDFEAKVWTSTPVTLANLMNQQMRWRRSILQSWLDNTVNLRTRIKTAGGFSTINCLLPAAIHFAIIIFLIYMFWQGTILTLLVNALILYTIPVSIVLAFFTNAYFRQIDPRQVLRNPVLSMFAFAVWSLIIFFLVTPFAMFTLDDGGWVTRQGGTGGNV